MDSTRKLKKHWVLTQAAFDCLMSCFDADRERAGEMYELLRLKLIKYFEWQNLLASEELADETINRVARKIAGGEIIQNLNGYIFGAARHLASERRKEELRAQSTLKYLGDHTQPLQSNDGSIQQLECCEACLSKLSEEKRKLIIEYYASEKAPKIEEHKRMADALGITLNSLRIRAHRIKLELEKCIVECEKNAAANERF